MVPASQCSTLRLRRIISGKPEIPASHAGFQAGWGRGEGCPIIQNQETIDDPEFRADDEVQIRFPMFR